MLARDSVRFRRQLGLVDQPRLGAMRVYIAGAGPVLPYLLQNLALLGFGKGRGEIRIAEPSAPIHESDLAHQFLWRPSDLGVPRAEAAAAALHRLAGDSNVTAGGPVGADLAIELAPGALGSVTLPALRGYLTRFGLWYGSGDKPLGSAPCGPVPSAAEGLTAPLASLAGALLAQEAVRVLGLFRPYPIERAALSLEIELPTLPDDVPFHARYDGIGGSQLPVTAQAGENGGRRVRVSLPPDLDLTWMVWERLHLSHGPDPAALVTPRPMTYFSPFEGVTAAGEDGIGLILAPRGKNITIAGLGGLGSWIAPLLAVSGLEESTIDLIDRDVVEVHNLNRQVLYGSNDVGRPKVTAAARRLRELGGGNEWHAHHAELSLDWLLESGDRLAGSDLLISVFDNAYARYLLGMFADRSAVDVLDCGGGASDGNLNLYRAGEHCILCHWGGKRSLDETYDFAHRREAQRCQMDDAGAALLAGALSTTTAVLASVAAAVALVTLAQGDDPGSPRATHQLSYLAYGNALHKCPTQERLGHDGCRYHRHGERHEAHARMFEDELSHLRTLALPSERI